MAFTATVAKATLVVVVLLMLTDVYLNGSNISHMLSYILWQCAHPYSHAHSHSHSYPYFFLFVVWCGICCFFPYIQRSDELFIFSFILAMIYFGKKGKPQHMTCIFVSLSHVLLLFTKSGDRSIPIANNSIRFEDFFFI